MLTSLILRIQNFYMCSCLFVCLFACLMEFWYSCGIKIKWLNLMLIESSQCILWSKNSSSSMWLNVSTFQLNLWMAINTFEIKPQVDDRKRFTPVTWFDFYEIIFSLAFEIFTLLSAYYLFAWLFLSCRII